LEDQEAVWLYRDEEHQALIESRDGMVRYQPIAHLTARGDGSLSFDRLEWAPGFPLEIFEDPQLAIPMTERREWLGAWHSEREWLTAVHKTRYSNGIIGLTEELLGRSGPAPICWCSPVPIGTSMPELSILEGITAPSTERQHTRYC
jgi:hypothetical protein